MDKSGILAGGAIGAAIAAVIFAVILVSLPSTIKSDYNPNGEGNSKCNWRD